MLEIRAKARRSSRFVRQAALLASVSVVGMVASGGASARSLNGGSASFTSAPTVASDAATQAAQQAVIAARKTQDSLARAAKAVQDMQAAQAAARAAAAVRQTSLTAPVNVPNGLGAGGLLPNVPAGWTGANAPTQGVDSAGQTQVGIRQTTSSAILNWTSFNVGARTTLTFDQQGNAGWVALNRVDAMTGPSQILGNIKADGQVYVINQSGIIFGGASQINVGSLIASTAGITDTQFTSSGIYSTQNGAAYVPSFAAAGGKVVVEAGAAINTAAPSSVTSGGGFVLLLGSQVENAGSIGTPKGQTVLAAGDDFIIRPGFGTQANTTSTTRGSEIAPVILVGSTSGSVSNSGLVFAQQGDITLAGRHIDQSGALIATTSVNTRGTIHLLNSASDGTGSITLGANSLTSILPELASTETALDSQRDALIAASTVANLARAGSATGAFDNLSLLADRQDQSRVEIVSGGTVTFQGGSYTSAQGGQIAVSATQRIVTESGSTLDASGVRDVALAMASNNISVNVQGNELRDSPQNRDSGVLLSNDVWIDVRSLTLVPAGTGGYASDRYYTAGGLLEVGGYLGTTAHTIGEWSAVGGSITLSAPEVIAQAGSTFDISGGSLDYAAGWIRSTNLIGSDGRRYTVDNAPADMQFVSFAGSFSRTHNIQGQQDDRLTEIWTTVFDRGRTSLRWEDAYTVGRDAGRLILSTPTSVFEGTILADTIDGQRQGTERAAGVTDGYKVTQSTVAQNGTLALGQYDGRGLVGGADSTVVFGNIPDITAGANPETASYTDRKNTAFFDVNRINAANLGGIDIASTRSITVDAPLQTADGGVVTFKAPNIAINSDLVAHSGTVTLGNILSAQLVANQLVQYWALTNADGSAQVTIGPDAAIDLTGTWSDLAATGNAGAASINGGTLTVATTGGITLAQGSVIDVSSGAARSVTGKITGGKGGDISLITNDYENLPDAAFYGATRDAKLVLDGQVQSYGFTGGGTLTLNAAQKIVIGGTAAAGDLQLDTALFESGFSSYDITGIGGIAVAAGTQINPVVPVYRFTDGGAAETWLPALTTANPLGTSLTTRTGADITLATSHGDFTLGQGASIMVDPGRAVNIYAYGQTTIDGSITAKGGSVLVAGAQEAAGEWRQLGGNGGFSLTRSIWIGDQAVLDVSGYASTVTDTRGRTSGMVADGGSIALGGADGTASDAFVIIRPGALLDASGTSAMIDIIDGSTAVPTLVASNGGSIALNSNSGIYIDGMLRATAGGANASGGTLSMNLVSRQYSPTPDNQTTPGGIGVVPDAIRKLRNITITQLRAASGLSGGAQAGQADTGLVFGNAAISAEQVAQGGFGSLALKTSDLFVFKGDVNLVLPRSLTLAGGILSVSDATPNINVALAAPYVRIDGFTDNLVGIALYDPGLNTVRGPSLKTNSSTFSVTGDLLDIAGDVRFGVFGHQGSGSLRYVTDTNNTPDDTAPDGTATSGGDIVDAAGFAQVNFTSRGDIRFGTGTVKAPGDLNITASQIYPLSGQSSALYAGLILRRSGNGIQPGDFFDDARPKTITIRGDGTVPDQPASAFGDLSFIAAIVDQGGVVRAPLGTVDFNTLPDSFTVTPTTTKVIFRAGSVTSASADGLIMPFGGTSDGTSYQGADGTLVDLGSALVNTNGGPRIVTGIAVSATSVVGEAGALLDLSGGGTLTGAGFVSGRGGSVNVLTTPLVNANPAYAKISAKGDQVYAIVPGYASAYAPVVASNGAGDPAIGRQVTIPAGVPGLPAGTYTLLPSSYALLPGAFRVEIGAAGTRSMTPSAMPNGTYVTSGILGIANTGIRDALPTQLLLTSGATVRTYSQYNETSYADFARSQAAIFGDVRPRLPDDGKILEFSIGASTGAPSLSFAGTANFAPSDDGIAGSLLIISSAASNIIDITAPGATPVIGHSSISSADLNAFNAATLFVGGAYLYNENSGTGTGPRVALVSGTASGAPTVNVLDGADLRSGQVFLVGNNVTVGGGATIDTRGFGATGLDSSFGYVFANSDTGTTAGPAVLAVANGWLNFLPPTGTATMTIGSGATLLTEGSIVLSAPGALTMGDVNFGARYLTVAQDQINIGDAQALTAAQAAGVLPAGWSLNQAILNQLLHPSSMSGVPALERLTLTAAGAINLFGSIALDARSQSGSEVAFVLSTPAIYGLGSASDTVSIAADRLIWNGVRIGTPNSDGTTTYSSKAPTAIRPNGAGTGTGNLVIQANEITLGYDEDSRPTDGATLDRVAIGFANVSLSASQLISGNSDGTLSVGQSKDSSGTLVGGNLTLTRPLLTGEQGSTIDYKAGGAIRVVAATAPADTASVSDQGGTISFTGDSVLLDTAVALPSGKLTLTATNDVVLGGNSRIDLAGRAVSFFGAVKYGWGGDLVLSAAHGDITQNVGSVIDVSAAYNDAGTVTAAADDAAHGHIALNGTLLGAATSAYDGGFLGGQISLRAQDLGDFAALNRKLNDAGFFGARNFDLKQGNLTIGDEVRASTVSISVDGGYLTVAGTIDATGDRPGTIRLAARDNLTLESTAVLDTRAKWLQTDSNGAVIDAENTPNVELTTATGRIVLQPNATIDMRSPDGVARGKLALDAPRLGGTNGDGDGANDIAIDASGSLNIFGAASIALNAFRDYKLAGGSVIDQAYFDTVDAASTAFINAAWANTTLQDRLAGLKAYGTTFHLRPGVEIDADGDLTLKGDLDLSNYRYGPDANPAVRGSGEPGVLVLRVTGNTTINGSINDGFAPPPGTPDDGGWVVMQAGLIASNLTLAQGVILGAGSTFPVDSVLGYSIPLGSVQLAANTAATKAFTLSAGVTLPAGYIVTTALRLPIGFGPGQTVTSYVATLGADAITQADWFIAPGSPIGNLFDSWGGGDVYFPGDTDGNPTFVTSGMTVPKGSRFPANDTFAALPAGFVVPANVFPKGLISSDQQFLAAGTKLAADTFIVSGTQIPVGFTFPQAVVLQAGPTLRANVVLPQAITLSADVTVPTAFVSVATITTPTQVFAAGTTIPANTVLPSGTKIGAGNKLPFDAPLADTVWQAGNALSFTDSATTTANVKVAAGQVLPGGTTALGAGGNTTSIGADGKNWTVAPMLAPGTQSWSITLASGADMVAADTRILRTMQDLQGSGNLTLNDPHFSAPLTSVIRTGTGDLSILVGGNYSQQTPFGVYTAGAAIDATGTSANAPYNVGRGSTGDGSVLGSGNADYEATLNAQRMYYAQGGGDFLLVAQGDIGGNIKTNDSTLIGNWLWRQGGNGQAAAWGINFGSYVVDLSASGSSAALDAFSGMGTLGGGNVTLKAGRDIGNAGQGIVVAVGSSGQVLDGSLTQYGGGTLSVSAGRNIGTGGNQFVALRGDANIAAGSFGTLTANLFGYNGANDPRPADTLQTYGMRSQAGGSFAIGDGTIDVRTRGDLAMGTIDDPGRVGLGQQTATDAAGTQQASWFTLWTPTTAVDLMAAGGDVAPLSAGQGAGVSTLFLPPILRVAAASGDIYLTPAVSTAGSMQMPSVNGSLDLLAQGSVIEQFGQGNAPIGALTTSLSSLATPFRPAWVERTASTTGGFSWIPGASNVWSDPAAIPDNVSSSAYSYDNGGLSAGQAHTGTGGILFAFGQNTVTDDSAMASGVTSRIYAVNGDITGLGYGDAYSKTIFIGSAGITTVSNRPAKPVDIMAGGDIVNLKGMILQNDPTDISTVAAGGNVIYAGVPLVVGSQSVAGLQVAGPGTLEVSGGRTIYQGAVGGIESIGALVQGDARPGASIVLQAGIGAGTPGVGQVDWAGFAALYLDPANLAGAGALADQPGKVAKTYDSELTTWLKDRFGYNGSQSEALAYFNTLAGAQQRIFLRQVYYAELTAGGREYNDASSSRFHSYLRGREAIATLFPADTYAGDITMFSAKATNGTAVNSGFVHTDFGGDIQFLAPGGQVTIGTEGLAPGADAGLITQGAGDIQVYADGSVLLGLSRVMTTFGGDILMWSASGDINAGRGSKTTVLYTPPKRTYDNYGNVALAPQVPSSGAGIATLNPIPAVPPGDIDLIAPLGTIDAGEAGIRVSGNVNLAALQVVNAANISVQGSSTGIPTVQAPSITAALATTNATAASQQTATPNQGSGNERPSVIIVEVLGYGGGGDADDPRKKDDDNERRTERRTQNPDSRVQVLGAGELAFDEAQRLADMKRSSSRR